MNSKHAKLSASSSARWLNCPGSIKAEEQYDDEFSSSIYAQEGTNAHELAETCLMNDKDSDYFLDKKLSNGQVITSDMVRFVQEYLDYVRSHFIENSELFIEKRVDFSNVVPEGFGTLDSAVLNYDSKTCHIFDLKYGKGVPVDAFENTQSILYSIGMYNEFGFLDEIENFRIHIVQPRLNSYSHWDISVEELMKFYPVISEKAELALTSNAPRVPGQKQCQWCKAKASCEPLAKFTEQTIAMEFDNMENLDSNNISDDRKKTILDNRNLIESFFKAIEKDVFNRITSGEEFPGYKIVHGRSVRKWTDEAEKILTEKLGKDAYEKKLIGITKAEKLTGKDVVESLTVKPPGKLTLVPDSDKRRAVIRENVTEEFDDETHP